nr:MAG TPA: hypothetical protein [Caudoviricetes sp.]
MRAGRLCILFFIFSGNRSWEGNKKDPALGSSLWCRRRDLNPHDVAIARF